MYIDSVQLEINFGFDSWNPILAQIEDLTSVIEWVEHCDNNDKRNEKTTVKLLLNLNLCI